MCRMCGGPCADVDVNIGFSMESSFTEHTLLTHWAYLFRKIIMNWLEFNLILNWEIIVIDIALLKRHFLPIIENLRVFSWFKC